MQRLLLQENVGLLIAAARRRIKQAVWKRLRPLHVTPAQSAVLRALHEGEEMSQVRCAQVLGIDAPMACRILRSLADKRLVKLGADPKDRRRFAIKLTPSGERLAVQLGELFDDFNRSAERGLTNAEKESLRTVLGKIIANMDEIERKEPSRAVGGRR
jgi:DNA-binding MarR family transcriptional regulator